MLTQAKGNALITVETIAALSEYGRIFEAVIHDRVAYAASITDGRTALENAPRGPAAREVKGLRGLLRKHINDLAHVSEFAYPDRRAKAMSKKRSPVDASTILATKENAAVSLPPHR